MVTILNLPALARKTVVFSTLMNHAGFFNMLGIGHKMVKSYRTLLAETLH
jgi:hypothetical protein